MEINLEMPSPGDNRVDTDNKLIENLNVNDEKSASGLCYYDHDPQKGLEFETKEAAYSFYREYARSVGFGITIKASRRSKKSGKFIDVKIACSRFGTKRSPTADAQSSSAARSCPKTDCKAGMHMKRRPDGKWCIHSVVKEHNHDICPDDFYLSIRGGRYKQQFPSLVVSPKKGLQLALPTQEDVNLLLDHLSLVQSESPNFYYAVDFNTKEKCMQNVFWIDPEGRNDYEHFFDVVFFDTSYLGKGYTIPFLPVVGVNHHSQYILIGGALIGDETSSSFAWLMRTWLRAVGGKSPTVVITAADKPLKQAVADVFPHSRHCYCLWHILGEISKNLSSKPNINFEDFQGVFDICIHKSWTNEEFQNRWLEMVDKFELRNDDWIRSLYEDREKWVPTYMRDTFLGGLSTIERSQSLSSFFDKYLHKGTMFREFLNQYKSFLIYRDEEEDKAEVETRRRKPILKSISSFEKEMSTTYTRAIFKKFQAEVLAMAACNLQREVKDETTGTFQVNDLERHQNFVVAWKAGESDISCSCRSFEYRGFLCRHAMIILQLSGVPNIPSKYVLKRWTKDAKIRGIMSFFSSSLSIRVQRLSNLCKFASRLGEEGSLSRETYDITLFALEEALKQCVSANNSTRSVIETNNLVTQGLSSIEHGNRGSNVDKASKRKKILKKRMVQQDVEASYVGIQCNSQKMEQLKQRILAFDTSFVAQPDLQGMELSTRTMIPDRYCDAQQSGQGLGQLSSPALLREGYYSNQHGVQGLLGNFNSFPTQVGHCAPQQTLQGLLQGTLGFRAPTTPGCFDIQHTLQDMGDR